MQRKFSSNENLQDWCTRDFFTENGKCEVNGMSTHTYTMLQRSLCRKFTAQIVKKRSESGNCEPYPVRQSPVQLH